MASSKSLAAMALLPRALSSSAVDMAMATACARTKKQRSFVVSRISRIFEMRCLVLVKRLSRTSSEEMRM